MHIFFFLTFYTMEVCTPGVYVNYVCNDLSGLNLRFLFCCFVFISFAIRLVSVWYRKDRFASVCFSFTFFYIKHMYINAY